VNNTVSTVRTCNSLLKFVLFRVVYTYNVPSNMCLNVIINLERCSWILLGLCTENTAKYSQPIFRCMQRYESVSTPNNNKGVMYIFSCTYVFICLSEVAFPFGLISSHILPFPTCQLLHSFQKSIIIE
jgi:hypothetical protein